MMDYDVPISDSDDISDLRAPKERRRQMRIDRRRTEILDAAKQVFLAREYNAVTIDDIAESAAF